MKRLHNHYVAVARVIHFEMFSMQLDNFMLGNVTVNRQEEFHSTLFCLHLGAVPITGAFINYQWPVMIYDINCTGSEQTVKDCPHNGIANHLCQQREAASLICQSEYSGLVRFIS